MEQIADLIGRQNMDDAVAVIVLMAIAFIYVFYCEVHFRENPGMSRSDQKIVVSGQWIGSCGLLFIVLLLLKVGVAETAVVGWSWWIITAPLWGPFVPVMGILLTIGVCLGLGFLGGLVITTISSMLQKRRNKQLSKERKNKG